MMMMRTAALIHNMHWGIVFSLDWWFYYVRVDSFRFPLSAEDSILRKSEVVGALGGTTLVSAGWQVWWYRTWDDIDAFEVTFESNRTQDNPLGFQIPFPKFLGPAMNVIWWASESKNSLAQKVQLKAIDFWLTRELLQQFSIIHVRILRQLIWNLRFKYSFVVEKVSQKVKKKALFLFPS